MTCYPLLVSTNHFNLEVHFPEKKVILVTGGNGQLGKELRSFAREQDRFEFIFSSRDTLDISDQAEVYNAIKKFSPAYVVNCAAYTNVDKAESESELAFLINSTAVNHVVGALKIYGGKLIHFSTDYVYDTISDRPINEDDSCEPKSVYGKSKRAGELVLEASDIDWINIRVSWLYSSFNHNFVKTMLRLGAEREELSIVSDQVGTPTYTRDLTQVIYEMIKKDDPSLMKSHYNFSNNGVTNWASFAKEIFKQTNIKCKVGHTTTEAYDAPAPRPLWSVMSKDKITKNYEIKLRDWQESLSACLSLVHT